MTPAAPAGVVGNGPRRIDSGGCARAPADCQQGAGTPRCPGGGLPPGEDGSAVWCATHTTLQVEMPRRDRPACSARSSCVSPAATRCCRKMSPKLTVATPCRAASPGTSTGVDVRPRRSSTEGGHDLLPKQLQRLQHLVA